MVGENPDTVGDVDAVDLDTHVRHEVIRWRHRRGWTQPEFAEHLRPCLPEARRTWAVQPNISRFESGAAADLTTIFAMARALGRAVYESSRPAAAGQNTDRVCT